MKTISAVVLLLITFSVSAANEPLSVKDKVCNTMTNRYVQFNTGCGKPFECQIARGGKSIDECKELRAQYELCRAGLANEQTEILAKCVKDVK